MLHQTTHVSKLKYLRAAWFKFLMKFLLPVSPQPPAVPHSPHSCGLFIAHLSLSGRDSFMPWWLKSSGQHAGKPGFAHWQCWWGGYGSPVPLSTPQARACWLGGREETKEFFPSSCHCPLVACDLCFFVSSGASALCVLGCWHMLVLHLHPPALAMSS